MLQKSVYEYLWEIIVILSTSFLAIFIPLNSIFSLKKDLALFQYLELLISIIYFLDIFYSVWRCNKKSSEFSIWSGTSIRSYLKNKLWVDIIVIPPWDLIFGTPLFGLIRLVKIIKVNQYMGEFKRQEIHLSNTLSLAFFIFWIVHFSHWVSCFWLKIRDIDYGLDLATNYTQALYWSVTTLTTIGYGDIVPKSNDQMIFTIFIQLMGVGLYGYVIANITAIVTKGDPAKVEYQNNIERLSALINYRRLPKKLHIKLRDYYTYLWKKRMGFNEISFLENLPEGLQKEVAIHLKKEVVEKIPIFKNTEKSFVKEVAMHLKPMIATPGDFIFKKNDHAEELFFVVKGKLEVLDRKQPIGILEKGDFFGEIALVESRMHNYSVKAVTFCDLYYLKRFHFDRIMSSYPKVAALIREEAESRSKKNNV